jgi:hypothetical protein
MQLTADRCVTTLYFYDNVYSVIQPRFRQR